MSRISSHLTPRIKDLVRLSYRPLYSNVAYLSFGFYDHTAFLYPVSALSYHLLSLPVIPPPHFLLSSAQLFVLDLPNTFFSTSLSLPSFALIPIAFLNTPPSSCKGLGQNTARIFHSAKENGRNHELCLEVAYTIYTWRQRSVLHVIHESTSGVMKAECFE